MKPDVIVTWPRHCDYPLWRRQLRETRDRYGRIIVVFTDHHQDLDLRTFVTDELGPTVTTVDCPDWNGRDWRDVAVNHALTLSDSDIMLFTEQDFFITNRRAFFAEVDEYGTVGCWDEPCRRWHPCFLRVPRAAVERTSRYFGPLPVDHFHAFGRELDIAVHDLGYAPARNAIHLAGLSHNHRLIAAGELDEVYHADEFRVYLRRALIPGERLHPDWLEPVLRFMEMEEPRG